jgi:Phosphotransferase enzyme family
MTEPSDQATYRVIVLQSDGTEVLLTRSHAGVEFPVVTIPRWERVAENVTSEMKREWGEVVVCLFEPDLPADADAPRYVAARHWRTCGEGRAPLQWTALTDLTDNVFRDPDEFRALHESVAKCAASTTNAASGPFARLHWFEELCGWVSQSVAARHLYLTGDLRQLNASPTFSLIRFETNGPAVWFKAVGEPNEREFPITLELARDFPRFAPQFVASRSDWRGWLTLDAEGTNLAETADLSPWTRAAAALARLQIESISRSRRLLDLGAHDLTPATLDKAISPFLDVVACLMRKQIKTPPPIIPEEDLALLGERIHEAVSALRQLGIPDTLGHLDLNPGNMIVARHGCVFLDWAEAYVGHPFYSFQYLLEHFRRFTAGDPIAERALTTAYLAPWTGIASGESLTESMALAPLVAAFAYGAGPDACCRTERLRDPKLAGYVRSLARRMNREANLLSERTTPCLS